MVAVRRAAAGSESVPGSTQTEVGSIVATMLAVPNMPPADLALSIALGVGLAAAVGFRVFLPMLVISIAAFYGHLHLSSGFAWLGTMPALTMLAVAALLEIVAYYVPGIDNLLDVLATPAALIAGTVVAAAVMMFPFGRHLSFCLIPVGALLLFGERLLSIGCSPPAAPTPVAVNRQLAQAA